MSDDKQPTRLLSLDAFRGAVIACMVFVNLLGESRATPAWLLHAEAYTDRYTFTDLVFAGFLFIVGVSIPLALHQRGMSVPAQVARILARGFWLLVVGVVLEFHSELSERNTGMRELYWMCLFYVGILLAFQVYPVIGPGGRQRLWRALRYAGFALMLVLIALFRGNTAPDGAIPWLEPQWWGILGLIGWAYMFVSLVYLAVRGRDSSLGGALALMIALCIGYKHGALAFLPARLTDWVDPGNLGSLGANATAGALVGNLLLRRDMSGRTRVGTMLRLDCALYVGGLLLRPLHGISKIGATESYSLVASGLSCAAFAIFYGLIDVWKVWRPGPSLIGVGRNSLFAYMMPSLWAYVTALLGLTRAWEGVAFAYFQSSWPLVCLNAIGLTLFYLGVVYGLGKVGVRLQL